VCDVGERSEPTSHTEPAVICEANREDIIFNYFYINAKNLLLSYIYIDLTTEIQQDIMKELNTILIVAIVVLMLLICDQRMRNGSCGKKGGDADIKKEESPVDAKEGLNPGDALALLHEKTKNPEQYAQMEQMEGFAVCNNPDETSRVLDCVCGDDPSTAFAEYDYGKPGLDYKAFVTSQAVDAAVIHNHLQFVHGPNGYYSTGRTYSPDSHESYDPIPWIGLRRPEYVTQCNPTQVPDVDLDLYKRNRQFCFQT